MRQKIINRFNLELKLRSINVLKHFKDFSPGNQILIFSDPRGGSTWLTEMISTLPHTAIIWEPLNIHEVRMVKKLGFGWRQYIPEEQIWPEASNVIRKILSGRLVNEWTMLNTTLKDYYLAKQLIVKICRGNMLLPWITHQIDFNYPPVYLVRHPFAVVVSQMKQGGWNFQFRKFEVPDISFNEIYREHIMFLTSLETKEEILTAYWCLTNQIPLNHAMNNRNWITLYYEDLVRDPLREITGIFQRWQMDIPKGIERLFRRKSVTSMDIGQLDDPENQLSKWRKELDPKQIKRMGRVLDYFNIRSYNAEENLPIFQTE